MKLKLKAYAIWELGPREIQEDAMFPEFEKAEDTDRLFILCDGMGGPLAGEVASSTVCKAMSASVLTHCPDADGLFGRREFQIALKDAFDALDAKSSEAFTAMGTTLAFLKFHAGGCTIAHIGDSRVYHIRPGNTAAETHILFQTTDHSLVNELVKKGEMSCEEARRSSKKNVITRAMQPCMKHRSQADIHRITDIQPGDYFMLCSDGIWEQLADADLKWLFSEEGGEAVAKVNRLVEMTEQSLDNHSAILVQVIDVEDKLTAVMGQGDSSEEKDMEADVVVADSVAGRDCLVESDDAEDSLFIEEENLLPVEPLRKPVLPICHYFKYLAIGIIVALLAWGGYWIYQQLTSPADTATEHAVLFPGNAVGGSTDAAVDDGAVESTGLSEN